jgi:K+-sensing histidine kinase KdpD
MSKKMTLIKSLDRLLKIIVLRVVKYVRISHGAVYLKEDGGYRLRYGYGKETELIPKNIPGNDPLVEVLIWREGPVLREEEKKNWAVDMRFAVVQASVVVPTFIDKQLIGFLALGEKISRQAYTQEDLDVFKNLSEYAALGIENALFVKEREETHAKLVEVERFRATAEMMGSMNHELRNLLTTGLLGIQTVLLQKSPSSETVSHPLKVAMERLNTAAEILADFNHYQKNSSMKEWAEIEIGGSLEEALAKLKPRLEQAGIVVHQEIASGLGTVKAIPTFANLFGNFLKCSYFTLASNKSQERRLWIQAKRNGKEIEVEIKDSGDVDIVESSQSSLGAASGGKLFTERKQLGGVNLYLAQMIAHDHGFAVKISSDMAQGWGAVFQIRMPITEEKRAR